MARHPDVYEWVKDKCGRRFLKCKYCHEVLDSKFKSSISKVDRHVKSDAHRSAQHRWQEAEALKQQLFVAVGANQSKPTLADVGSAFRCATISAFLGAGISLNKISAMRPFLEHYCNAKLDDVSNMKKVYLPRLRFARRPFASPLPPGGGQHGSFTLC
jgi:hypothetical protein